VVDSVPPTLRLANLDELSRVREANLTVEGLTDPDAVVQVEGDPTVIPVDAEGRFTLKQQLLEGSNVIEVTATDPAGNVATVAREVILVTKPPEVVIDNPVNGYWTNENLLNITGVVPAGASLKVNGQEATVNEDGTFEREVILQEGDNIISVAATDDVGNISSKDIIIHRKTTPPDLSVNVEEGQLFQQEEVQIIGKTNPGATVLVGGQKVDVSSLGEFQATVKLLQGDNLLDVVTQDQAGNTTRLQRRLRFNIPAPESELARVARNLPDLSAYFVPVLISLPVLLILAYILTRPVALVISAESSAFQPGLPEEGRFLRLSLDLSKAARTTVEIRDKRENTIATLLHRRHRGSGQHTLYWDGYDDFGRVVPPGEYTVYAAASTTGGSVTGNLNISIVPDRTAHRQYLRTAPHQDDTSRRSGEAIRTGASQLMRRRS
jgi:flagellar hook assembly protein FlgD